VEEVFGICKFFNGVGWGGKESERVEGEKEDGAVKKVYQRNVLKDWEE
jgi:hypothetical protein